jgi:hypothetical protein
MLAASCAIRLKRGYAQCVLHLRAEAATIAEALEAARPLLGE